MKEHQNIEYKQSWRGEYLKWICGFANADGGTLFIGINDKGQVVGISQVLKLLEDIPNKVRDILGILVDVNLKSSPDGEYLEIIVESYPYPINYKGQYHYRSGSTKQELTGAALNRFLLRKQGKNWDGVPIPYVQVKDLEPYNPDIANVFFRSGMIEAWGRGVEKVFDACRKSGIKAPDFRYEHTGLWVEFVFSNQETEKTTQEIEIATQEAGETTQETEKTTQETTQQKILTYIKDKPDLTRRELADKIGISSNGVKYHLDKLKNRGVIRHVGATKKGHWEILS